MNTADVISKPDSPSIGRASYNAASIMGETMRTLALLLVAFLALQFTGGIGQLERRAPGAICWSLAPSFGERDGMCSHGGGVMIWLWPEESSFL